MRVILFTLVLLTFISCNDGTKQNMAETAVATTDFAAVKDEWVADFKKFRDAVYHDDIVVMKSYFKFPIHGSEIWLLAFWGQEFQPEQEFIKSKNGFSEQDFKTYKASLFQKEFIKALLKIKTDSLLVHSEYETVRIHKNDSFSYHIIATVENNKTLLRLFYNYEIIHRDEKGEILDGGESSIIYLFEIIDRKKIMFKGLEFAG